jgi:hypothetical protein
MYHQKQKKESKTFLSSFGIEPLDIPLPKVAIVDPEKLSPEQREYLKKEGIGSYYHTVLQTILLYEKWEEGGRLKFLQVLIHEMIHVQAFESWQHLPEDRRTGTELVLATDDETAHLALRRVGFLS